LVIRAYNYPLLGVYGMFDLCRRSVLFMFSFVDLCRPYIPCNSQDVSTTGDTSDITRSLFSVALVCQVVTCAFNASWFEIAIIAGMPIFLTVRTSSNIPFVFGRFEFYFALVYIFYMECLLFVEGFSSTKTMRAVAHFCIV
jgi:hypothetical protein